MGSRHILGGPLVMLASGCAVVGPMYDRSYTKAPIAACADLTGKDGGTISQQPVRLGCFDVVARSFSAGQQISPIEHALTNEGLRLTNAAAFRLVAGGEGCAGRVTNLVVDYVAPGGGSADVTATDGIGRHLSMKSLRAEASPKPRRFVLRDMQDALRNPSVAEFTNVQGELFIRSICLKGY